MIRALTWIVVRLSILVAPAWIVAAIAAAHYLPGIAEGADTPAASLVPGDAGAVATQQRELRDFGSTLLTRVVLVQHRSRRLSDRQVRRTASFALKIDRHRAHGPIAFAAPLLSHDHTTLVTYLYFHRRVDTHDQLDAAHASQVRSIRRRCAEARRWRGSRSSTRSSAPCHG